MERIVKTFEEFITESFWGDIHKRSIGDEVRSEDGTIIGKTEDGTSLVLGVNASSDGTVVEFDDDPILRFGDNLYVAIVSDDNTDVFYAFDEDKDINDGDGNMTRCFEVDSSLRTKYDFKPLRAIIQTIKNEDLFWDDDLFFEFDVDVRYKWTTVDIRDDERFRLFYDRNDAIEYAVEREIKGLEESLIEEEDVERWIDIHGYDIFDTDWFEDATRELQEFYYDDRDEDDIINDLLDAGIIEDSEEYFELDEDGNIDHTQPKFDYRDYKDKYVDNVMKDIDNYVEYYIENNDIDDNVKNHIDFDKLARSAVKIDGPELAIAGYDGVEREETVDGTTYYIYREK